MKCISIQLLSLIIPIRLRPGFVFYVVQHFSSLAKRNFLQNEVVSGNHLKEFAQINLFQETSPINSSLFIHRHSPGLRF
jgi:hypothetical protein